MSRIKTYFVIALILVLSVPWLFVEPSKEIILGFPLWGIYSITITILFAIVVAIIIEKKWDSLSGGDEDE